MSGATATRSVARGSPHEQGVLARRLGRSFASVTVVAMITCVVLLLLLARVAGSVHQMQRDESAIRRGLDLATAVREQYIHAAHTVIAGDGSHLDHYAEWVTKVHDGTVALSSIVPPAERWRVDRIQVLARDMDRLFRTEVVPLVLARDRASVVEAHRRLDELASIAASDSDLVARSIEARMAGEHTDATYVTYLAAALALLGIVVLIAMSIALTRRLQTAVLRPLAALTDAAHRIGSGDLTARVPIRAEGELALVASAFDTMVEQLSDHQRRLVANERMAAIGQLAAGVAHEINNPIGVIRGYLRTMIPETEREEVRRELEILDEEAATCQRIADDLVAYARSPELNLALASQDIGALVEQTAARFQMSHEAEGCHVSVEAEHCDVVVDGVRVRQVVQNLLRNAVQASEKGCKVELVGEASNSSYLIHVRDRGSGVPSEIAPRIFEPFMSGRSNGSGLGLAVSNGILRAHGGSIEMRARDGGGTEFVVRLPRAGTASGGRDA
jgi:two-component system, NtrC family, sensor kinase